MIVSLYLLLLAFLCSVGNTGSTGFKAFFEDHICNDVCRELGLKPNAMMKGGSSAVAASSSVRTDMTRITGPGHDSPGLCPCGQIIAKLTLAEFKTRSVHTTARSSLRSRSILISHVFSCFTASLAVSLGVALVSCAPPSRAITAPTARRRSRSRSFRTRF